MGSAQCLKIDHESTSVLMCIIDLHLFSIEYFLRTMYVLVQDGCGHWLFKMQSIVPKRVTANIRLANVFESKNDLKKLARKNTANHKENKQCGHCGD